MKYEYLTDSPVLNPRPFVNVKPVKGDDFVDFVKTIINHDSPKVLIVPDIDIDGMLSAKVIKDCLSQILYFEVDIYEHSYMCHGINQAITMDTLSKKYTHVIIVDSSTNEIEWLRKLSSNDVKVCVIDHHISNYKYEDYPKNVLILNNQMQGDKIPYKCVSCGLLCTVYCNYLLSVFNIVMPDDYWVYGVLTLYSDCMNLKDKFNVMVISHVFNNMRLNSVLKEVADKKTTNITRDLITHSINPKLNACLRLEMYHVIYSLLFTRLTQQELKELCKTINTINKDLKEYLSDLEPRLPISRYGEIMCINMSDEYKSVYINLKGQLANKVASRYGLLSIGYYISNGMVYGSVRDPLNRNCLMLFKEFCQADGHSSAFGFTVQESKFNHLLDYVNEGLIDLECDSDKPIVFNGIEHTPENMRAMMTYNEFAMNDLVMLKFVLSPDEFIIKSSKYGYTISTKKTVHKIISSIPVSYGNTVYAVPTLAATPYIKVKSIGG